VQSRQLRVLRRQGIDIVYRAVIKVVVFSQEKKPTVDDSGLQSSFGARDGQTTTSQHLFQLCIDQFFHLSSYSLRIWWARCSHCRWTAICHGECPRRPRGRWHEGVGYDSDMWEECPVVQQRSSSQSPNLGCKMAKVLLLMLK